MNEQLISDLFAEATRRMTSSSSREFSQKFAEVVVAKCTAMLFDESERLSELYSEEENMSLAEEYEIRSNQCIDDIALIEKHFGVEE